MRSMDESLDSGLFKHAEGTTYLHLMRELLLTYRQLMKRLAEKTGLSGAQFEVLRELALADGRSTVSALARALGVDAAAISRLVAGLQELGFVSRTSDDRDGRRQPVVLTDDGRRRMVALHDALHGHESAVTGTVDSESLETTMRVLRGLRDTLGAAGRDRR